MINIRQNVFETNSSSMHSLVIVKHPKPYNSHELKFNVWSEDRDFNLFDWHEAGTYERSPYRVLRTPLQKLQYYVAYTLGTCGKTEKIDEIKQFIHKHTNVPLDKIDLYHRESHCNRKGEWHETKDFGCVYENDTGEDVFSFVRRKNITMEDLILNPKYVIITDGDEYQLFKALFESNIIMSDTIEDISSGLPFWTDSSYEIYINWFRPDMPSPSTDEDLVDGVNQYTEELVFAVDTESRKYYNPERICHVIELAKQKSPNLKTRLCNTGLRGKMHVGGLDVSMFDKVDLDD